MPNSPEIAVALYACFRVGAIACPTNLRFTTAELREVFQCPSVSTIETDQRFSGREDFWIIAAARSEDETEIRAGKAAGGRRDQGHSARAASTLFS
jgi:acyl-CoA synthetase (AMP-forming)/AMP-acid ligase II